MCSSHIPRTIPRIENFRVVFKRYVSLLLDFGNPERVNGNGWRIENPLIIVWFWSVLFCSVRFVSFCLLCYVCLPSYPALPLPHESFRVWLYRPFYSSGTGLLCEHLGKEGNGQSRCASWFGCCTTECVPNRIFLYVEILFNKSARRAKAHAIVSNALARIFSWCNSYCTSLSKSIFFPLSIDNTSSRTPPTGSMCRQMYTLLWRRRRKIFSVSVYDPDSFVFLCHFLNKF